MQEHEMLAYREAHRANLEAQDDFLHDTADFGSAPDRGKDRAEAFVGPLIVLLKLDEPALEVGEIANLVRDRLHWAKTSARSVSSTLCVFRARLDESAVGELIVALRLDHAGWEFGKIAAEVRARIPGADTTNRSVSSTLSALRRRLKARSGN